MPTIDQLSSTSTVNAGDKVPVYVQGNGDARSATMRVLLDFVEANFASPDYVTQIFAPSVSGTSIQLVPQTQNLWVIINPTGAFAALTLVLPPSVGALYADGAQILVTSTNTVTALTINGNGATVVGAPSGLGIGGFFTLRYNKLQNTWYCTSQSLGASDVLTTLTLTGFPVAMRDRNGRPMVSFIPDYFPEPGPPADADYAYVAIRNGLANDGAVIQSATVDNIGDIDLGIQSQNDGNIILSTGANGSIRVGTSSQYVGIDASVAAISGQLGVSINGESLFVICSSVFASAAKFDNLIRITPYTLSSLITRASVYGAASRLKAFCSDSAVPATGNFGATFAGGGANLVPCYYDGTDWRIG